MGFTIIAARIPRSSEPLAPLFAPMRNSPVTGPVSAAADELLQTTKFSIRITIRYNHYHYWGVTVPGSGTGI